LRQNDGAARNSPVQTPPPRCGPGPDDQARVRLWRPRAREPRGRDEALSDRLPSPAIACCMAGWSHRAPRNRRSMRGNCG